MGSQSIMKMAVRAGVSAVAASLALSGCVDYGFKNITKEQLASLYNATPTPGGGFIDPGNEDPTPTPIPTPTRTPTITNTPIPVAASVRLEFAPSNPVNGVEQISIGRCVRVQVVSQSSNGVEYPVSTATGFSISAVGAITGTVGGLAAGLFSNGTCTTNTTGVNILANTSRASFYVRGAILLQHALSVTRNSGMLLGTASVAIAFVRGYDKLVLSPEVTGATELPGGRCYRVRAQSRSFDDVAYVQPTAVQVRGTINAILTAYSAAGCATAAQLTGAADANGNKTFVTTIPANGSTVDFWIRSSVAGGDTARLTIAAEPANATVVSGVLNLNIVPAIVSLRWSITTQPVIAGVCSGEAAQASASLHTAQVAELRGYALNGVAMDPPAGQSIAVQLTAPAGTSIFSTAACGTTIASAFLSAGSPVRVWVKAAAPGTTTVTATTTDFGTATFNVVASNGPSGSRFKPFPAVAVTECSDPLEIEIVNALGQTTLVSAAGAGSADLTIAGLSSGSKLYRADDPSCTGAELSAVTVASGTSSSSFRLKTALTDPPTSTLALSVTTGPLKTVATATLPLGRKDLETDRGCLDQNGNRAGRNMFRMLQNYDEVAYTALRFPSGKFLVGGDASAPPTDAGPAVSHGALALVGPDCRLSTAPAFFATSTGYHVMVSSVLYPQIGDGGTGIRKVIPGGVNEAPSALTGATSFFAVGFANRGNGQDVFVARFRNDGTLDPTFGESTGVFPAGSSTPIRRGWLTVDLGLDDVAVDAALVDGRLVVVANSSRGSEGRVWLLLFDAVGNEAGSRAAIQFAGTKVDYGGFAMWSDGTSQFALVGGTLTSLSAQGEALSSDWFVSKNRLTVDGFAGQPSSPPINFGSQGPGDDDRLAAIAVQSVPVNGTQRLGVVMAGSTAQGNAGNLQTEAAFARLRLPGLELDINQGSQDPNEYFQNNGKLFLPEARNQTIAALALDLAGKVLGFGKDVDAAGKSRGYVARVRSNGDATPVSTKLTNTFDFGGTLDAFNGAVTRPDNKTFVVGATGSGVQRQFLVTVVLE